MDADRLEAALRITSHKDTTFHQCIGIELIPDRRSDLS
jgi:hypothetical protein